MEGGDLQYILAGILGLENEVCLAEEAVLYAFLSAGALPRVFEFFDCIADEGDESDPLAEELIVEDWGVFNDADEVGGEGGHFGDHDASESIRHAHIAAGECEFDIFSAQIEDLNPYFLHQSKLIQL